MVDKLLFTPGPLTTSSTVKAAMGRDLGSRDTEFIGIVRDLRNDLLQLAGVSQADGWEAVLMQGSGTFSIESVLSSITPPEGKWLFVITGVYGELIIKIIEPPGLAAQATRSAEHELPYRPAITAAALASLYNAGEYNSQQTKDMLKYCKKHLYRITGGARAFGHWHYTYLYYAQVVYRQGGKDWETFRDKLYEKISSEQNNEGFWQGNIGPIYVTACNLIMLQLDKGYIPIYQR